jgi:hypothetical protein
MRTILLIISFSLMIFTGCDRDTEMIGDPGIPPAVPTGLRVFFATDGEIAIEWNNSPEPDVKGYNVYRRTASTDLQKIAFVDNAYFFDDSLDYDTTYYYKVSALSIWNRESDLSDEVSATPINRYNPKRPIGVRINARNWEGDISIYLSWLGSEETDVAGFNIYRGANSNFIPDSTNLRGFSTLPNFTDTGSFNFYENYFYKVRAVDKGGLLSEPGETVSDHILEIPEVIFPPDSSYIEFFENFIIKTLDVPATYRIGFQTNKFFGEIWNATVSTSVVNDTLKIPFNPPSLQYNKTYYWRVAAYSGNNTEPNSISKIYSVTFKD